MYDRQYLTDQIIRIMDDHVGKDNAISADDLFKQATGDWIIPAKRIDQFRPIRSVVHDIRRNGLLALCSGNQGYWVAKDQQELEEFVEHFLARAKSTFKTAHKLSGIPMTKIFQQFQLNLGDDNVENKED